MPNLRARRLAKILFQQRSSDQQCCVTVGIATVILFVSLGGCQPANFSEQAARVLPPPARYDAGTPGVPPPTWFHFYGDKRLAALVDRALDDNFDVLGAWARLEEAQALARQAGAALWPAVDLQAQVQRQRTEVEVPVTIPGQGSERQIRTQTQYNVTLGAAYEIDLWGRLRNEKRAAALAAQASREEVNAIAMTVAARVTSVWLDLIRGRRELWLLERQLRNAREYLELAELRLGQGQGSVLDVTQQEQQLESIRAAIIQRRGENAVNLNLLAVLLGVAPQGFEYTPPPELPQLPPLPAIGLPADLLRRRPDLRAEIQRLKAADARLAAAVDDQLPRLRLNGSLFTLATDTADLFDTLLWSITGGLSDTLFAGGRQQAAVDVAEARARQQLYNYAGTFAGALEEVASALDRETALQGGLASVRRQLSAARSARQLATAAYRTGSADYQRLLDAIDAVYQLEREELRLQRELLDARLQLHRALGGA